MNLTDTIHCRRRKRVVTIDRCETGYCNANALRRKQSPCYQCAQGRKVRAGLFLEAPQDIEGALLSFLHNDRDGDTVVEDSVDGLASAFLLELKRGASR